MMEKNKEIKDKKKSLKLQKKEDYYQWNFSIFGYNNYYCSIL